MMKYHQINYLVDMVMPKVKPTTYVVITLIARRTWGMKGCQATPLSRPEIVKLTSISSIATVQKALDEAVAEGFIIRFSQGKNHAYSMTPIPEPDQKMIDEGSKNDRLPAEERSKIDLVNDQKMIGTDQKLIDERSKNDPLLKEKENKKEGKERETSFLPETPQPIIDMLQAFYDHTGYPMPHPSKPEFDEKWDTPMRHIFRQAKKQNYPLDKLPQFVKDTIDWMRNPLNGRKTYTIITPQSILRTAVGRLSEDKPANQTNLQEAEDAWEYFVTHHAYADKLKAKPRIASTIRGGLRLEYQQSHASHIPEVKRKFITRYLTQGGSTHVTPTA